MKKIHKIEIRHIKYLAFVLAKKHMDFDEPIPDFSTRFPNVLESCLATPFQGFGKRNFYPTLVSKTSILFYLMIKNHPFQNGNKRLAMTTMFVFLHENNTWLIVGTQELYNFAVWVASSPPKLKDETVKAVEKFIRTHLTDL